MSKIRVKQIRGLSSEPKKLRLVIERGLGLRRINHVKEFNDNNCIRGMLNKVRHLVSYELVK